MLIVTCDYNYIPKYKLTSIRDGQGIQRMAQKAHVSDITFMRDDVHCTDPLFPTAANLKSQLAQIGERTEPDDYFIFFYAGHADSVDSRKLQRFADQELAPEADGKDECFQLPGPNQEFDWKYFLVDDDFAQAVDSAFDEAVHVLVITDCCHSGTIADVDSHDWGDRPVVSFAACRDWEEATDTGRGGVLTKGLERAIRELAFVKGREEYTINAVWKRVLRYASMLEREQEPRMMYTNLEPRLSAWPMPQAWWKNIPGTAAFKIQQEIEAMQRDNIDPEEGVRAIERLEIAADEQANTRGHTLFPPQAYAPVPR